VRPPRVTVEMKPADCSARESRRIWFVEGTEVRPRRALEAFWRCEQTFERWTRDILGIGPYGRKLRITRRWGRESGLYLPLLAVLD